jgi:hypothetical protein
MTEGPGRPANSARRLGLVTLLAGILVALLGFFAPPASAAQLLHPQTRVAAIAEPNGQLVGPSRSVAAVQGRERAPNYDQHATGSSVAAEGETASADASSVGNAITSLSAGRSAGVYTVSSPEELQSLYDELSAGGTRLSNTYPGEMVELPDGTTVGLRQTSTSGGPTIDVKLPDGTQLKVHVSP